MISYIQYPKVGSYIPNISCIVQLASKLAASSCSSLLLAHMQAISAAEQPLRGSTSKRHRSCDIVSCDLGLDTQPGHTPHAGMSATVSSRDTVCAPKTPRLENVKKHKSAATSERPIMMTGVLAQQRETHGSEVRQRTWPLRMVGPETSAYLTVEARDFLHRVVVHPLRLNSGSDVLTALSIVAEVMVLTTRVGECAGRVRVKRDGAKTREK